MGGVFDLAVDTKDPGFTCFVNARLRLHGVKVAGLQQPGRLHHADLGSHLALCMDTGNQHGQMLLQGTEDNVFVHLQHINPNFEVNAKLRPTWMRRTGNSWKTWKWSTYWTLTRASSAMIKKAQKARTDHITIIVHITPDNALVMKSKVTFMLEGEFDLCMSFYKETRQDENGHIICSAGMNDAHEESNDMRDQDHLGMRQVYKSTFPVDKINAFIKTLPAKTIPTRITKGLPLVMVYKHPGGTTTCHASISSWRPSRRTSSEVGQARHDLVFHDASERVASRIMALASTMIR